MSSSHTSYFAYTFAGYQDNNPNFLGYRIQTTRLANLAYMANRYRATCQAHLSLNFTTDYLLMRTADFNLFGYILMHFLQF